MKLSKNSEYSLRQIYSDLLQEPLFSALPRATNAAHSQLPLASIRDYLEAQSQCTKCGLHVYRNRPVIGVGESLSGIVCVGDYPSEDDNKTGRPFSGASGELLHKMVTAIRLAPEKLFYTNLVICRAAHTPLDKEINACRPHLEFQLNILQPKFILAFGETTAQWFARTTDPLTALRQQEIYWGETRVFCTHHPRDLLQFPERKRQAWDDLQSAMKLLSGTQ